MNEQQGPAEHGGGGGDGGGEDLAVPMWVWTVLGFTLLMAVLIVVFIRGGARLETPPESHRDGESVTR